MKHLYWIVCGVTIGVILVAWFFVVPADNARASKLKLDQQSKDLKDLEKRAERGDPQGVFDAENSADTQRLANEYLITENWKRVLQPHVEKYEKQMKDLKAQLMGRGAYLHTVVAPTKNTLEWYNAYATASEALVVRLRDAGCLQRAAEDEIRSASGESPAAVRSSVGLFTRAATFPDPSQHAQMTTRLRAMELLADRLIEARLAVANNPLIGPTGRSEDRAKAAAVILSVEWTAGSEADGGVRNLTTTLSGQLQARSVGLRLTLEGPLSALLAASSTMERNAETNRPLVAVTSANLSRRDNGKAGDRFDIADDNISLVLAVEIIEFAETGTGTASDNAANTPSGMPPAMGFPPGIMPGRPPTSPGGR